MHVQARSKNACIDFDLGVDTTADPNGHYSADFQALGKDIDRNSEADVSTMDANGNSWVRWRHAPSVRISLTNNGGNGNSIAPDEDLTITLKNGSTVKDTLHLHSNSGDGGFGFRFDQADILAGDTVEITEPAGTLASILIPSLSVKAPTGTKPVTGMAGKNDTLVVGVDHYARATGQWQGSCTRLSANASTGQFSAAFTQSLTGSDDAYVYDLIDDGHQVTVYDNLPYLEMYKGQNYLDGTFHNTYNGEMTITVKSAAGVLKYTGKGYAFGGWWNQILAYNGLPVNLVVGDVVTVTPDDLTQGTVTSTVAKVTASIDWANNSITGSAPANAHLAVFNYAWMGWNYNCDQCFQDAKADSTGKYSFPFYRTLQSGDYVDALYVGPGGHRTIARGFSTNPNMSLVSYPNIFRRGRDNFVVFSIGGDAVHAREISMGWDSASRPKWNYTMRIGPDGPGNPNAGAGNYTMKLGFGSQGRIYFRGFAWVDGRFISTSPEIMANVR